MYFHVRISTKSNPRSDETKVDLSRDQLQDRFLKPYEIAAPIVINGKTIPSTDIARVRISQSDEPAQSLINAIRAEDRNGSVFIIGGPSDEWRAADRAEDLTDDLILGPPGYKATTNEDSSTSNRPGSRTPVIPVGGVISELRNERKLTTEEVARQTDLSVQTVRRAEHGERVSLFTIRAIAKALRVSPESLLGSKEAAPKTYQSAFISFGGPDEEFAHKLYEALKLHGVNVFFFPETSIPGKRLHRTMADAVFEYDRVILICSRNSLDRRGVLNEIEQVLTREADEGGMELIIPVAIDDYLFSDWKPKNRDIAIQIRARVVADFRDVVDSTVFQARFNRILRALELPD